MFEVTVNREFGRIVVRTDDPSVKYMFESVIQEKTYVRKNWIMLTKNIKIYRNQNDIKDDDGNFIFILNYGWASYVLRVFKSYLSVSDYNSLVRLLMSDTVRTIPFPGLRDYQNSDVLHLLRYNLGLLSCYTSYGYFKQPHYILNSETSGNIGEVCDDNAEIIGEITEGSSTS